eukprot:1160753-Pelagomonas_calceolata.AAC.3
MGSQMIEVSQGEAGNLTFMTWHGWHEEAFPCSLCFPRPYMWEQCALGGQANSMQMLPIPKVEVVVIPWRGTCYIGHMLQNSNCCPCIPPKPMCAHQGWVEYVFGGRM